MSLADYNDDGGIPMPFTAGPSVVWISSVDVSDCVRSDVLALVWNCLFEFYIFILVGKCRGPAPVDSEDSKGRRLRRSGDNSLIKY